MLKEVCEGGKGFRDVFYSADTDRAKGKLYALVSKTLSLRPKLEEALATVLPEEKFSNHYFTLAMLCDIVHGREISGGGSVKRLLEKNKAKLKKLLKPSVSKIASAVKPTRYLRIPGDVAEVEAKIKEELQIEATLLKTTEIPDVFELVDSSILPTLLKSATLKPWLFTQGRVFLQDKSTCMTTHCLLEANLPATTPVHVLDVCAAPGSKSLHLLSRLRSGDTLTMVEKNAKRADTLKRRLIDTAGWDGESDVIASTGVKVRVMVADFFTIRVPSATHISLDPSCSGSGLELHANDAATPARIHKLAELQSGLLRHALDAKAFPKVQTVVYSTCSLNREENQDVVDCAKSKAFTLADDYPKFLASFREGSALKAVPEKHGCRGFFLQKFKKIPQAKKPIVLAKSK